MSTHVFYGSVDCFEQRPLVDVESSSTAVKHRDATQLGRPTVAHVHTVIRTVVPLTRVLIQLLCTARHTLWSILRQHAGNIEFLVKI